MIRVAARAGALAEFANFNFKAPNDTIGTQEWSFFGVCVSAPSQQAGADARVKNEVFPLYESNWRLTSDLSPEAIAYYQFANGEFKMGGTPKLVTLGDILINKFGSRRKAVRE